MERCNLSSVAIAVFVVITAWLFWSKADDRGSPRFFADQTYNFQTLRALNDVAAAGGDIEDQPKLFAGFGETT
jgi:hypothetical protein